ncbi:MAG TPA: PAS domain-containing protein, partial [Phycisphaerae bacterium]|nr:PAS domain-containing protein [Phycisphaerae bacterium]
MRTRSTRTPNQNVSPSRAGGVSSDYSGAEDAVSQAERKLSDASTCLAQLEATDLREAGILAALNASQCVVEFGVDGTILSANDLYLRLLGYKLEELQGKNHSFVVDPVTAGSAAFRQHWAALAAGQDRSAEGKRITKDGKEIWLQTFAHPVLDKSGNVVKIVAFGFDITAAKTGAADSQGQLAAISKAQAVIEFNLDGTVITANQNFCDAIGYSLDEIKGKHHSMFVDRSYAASADYRQFWAELRDGKYHAGEFKRINKSGKEIWLQATYNAILDLSGRPFKVVKYATDITATKLRNADFEGQLSAISKAQAVIEFNLDGTIITANDNFLNTLGYRLDEIKGKHHSIFVEPSYAAGADYRAFWANLNDGKFQAAEYKRLGKGGKEVWIQASYNPIFDMNGRPFKVVKYAIDTTAAKLRNADFEGQLAAISKAQAVIEFNLDGTVITANDNFLNVLGYRLEEIKGKHHSLFVEPSYGATADYRQFWANLNAGKYQSDEFKRIGKGGKEVWIQASYNPIFDLNGRPFKVVKYATDVTAQVKMRDDLRNLLKKVADNSTSMSAASEELASVSTQMSANAEE